MVTGSNDNIVQTHEVQDDGLASSLCASKPSIKHSYIEDQPYMAATLPPRLSTDSALHCQHSFTFLLIRNLPTRQPAKVSPLLARALHTEYDTPKVDEQPDDDRV